MTRTLGLWLWIILIFCLSGFWFIPAFVMVIIGVFVVGFYGIFIWYDLKQASDRRKRRRSLQKGTMDYRHMMLRRIYRAEEAVERKRRKVRELEEELRKYDEEFERINYKYDFDKTRRLTEDEYYRGL